MKKLNLRGRELEKIGFPQGELISMTINLVHKYFRRSNKAEALLLLKKLIQNPAKYKNDPKFGQISNILLSGNKINTIQKPEQIKIEQIPRDYVIYGQSEIEQEAINQMDTAMRLPITVRGALMADAHTGYGLPIGGVLATRNAIIPYGVGMDIGCRMCLSVYNLPTSFLDKNRNLLKSILRENVKFGTDEFPGRKEHEVLERKEFKEIKVLKQLKDKAYNQLGTSGSGNHFVEFGFAKLPLESNEFNIDGGEYLAVLSHSGSRNFGASIARHYTRVAKEKCNLPKGAQNLAWLNLNEEEGTEYWLAMNLAGDYASANHQIIHQRISKALGEKHIIRVENHHNFAWKEKLEDGTDVIVHRKGATPAIKGILGVIPGSMTSPGFIIKGKGNWPSINSASHGAGRLLSRSKAKERFSKKTLSEALNKAGVELMGGGMDEAPGAYKDIYKVMEYQKELVDIIGVFYPKIVRMSSD
jgi:tRNA-splicing ligase RtcB